MLPLAHLDTVAIEEITIGLWRQIFEVVGWPKSIPDRDSFGHDDILGALRTETPTEELLELLDVVNTLGTETGREAIERAFAATATPMTSLPPGLGSREFAAILYLAQRADAGFADVFTRAQIEFEATGSTRRYNDFLGHDPRVIRDFQPRCAQLENLMRSYCLEHDLGDYVRVRGGVNDNVQFVHVVHTHRAKAPLAVLAGASQRQTLAFRPVHADVLRYDSGSGRLRIASRSPTLVEHYRRVAGKVFFDDETFFGSDGLCNLGPLEERGRRALDDHNVPGIGVVRMTECMWEHGGDTHLIRGPDCFETLERLGTPLNEGQLLQARLKIWVAGKSTRAVTVHLRVPSRIELSNKKHEQLIEEYLEAIGVRSPPPPPRRSGLWDSASAPQPLSIWRELFGPHTDALITQRALVPTRSPSLAHPEFPRAGRVLEVVPISKTEFHGASHAAEIPSRRLTSTDVDAFELDEQAFQHYLSRVLGTTGDAQPVAGVLDLGELEFANHRFRIYFAITAPVPTLGDALRRSARGVTPILLRHGPASAAPTLLEIPLSSPIPARETVVRDIIRASGLEADVPAVHFAPAGARLVVDTRRQVVWFDGIEVTALRAGGHAYNLVLALARAGGSPVDTAELASTLSVGRSDGNTTARQAKTKAKRAIADALASAGREPPAEEVFPPAGTGCYKCAVAAFVSENPPTTAEFGIASGPAS